MEFAAIIGKPLPMNMPLKATEVDEHIFGFVLLNDWSGKLILALENDFCSNTHCSSRHPRL
jgi:fumarylacetoacetase